MKISLRSVAAASMVGLAAPLLVATTAIAAPTSHAAASASSSNSKHITIPSNYSYHPHRGPHIPWHDYCTKSPDSFHAPFAKDANFRGSCARHDMCYQYRQHKTSTCDLNFYNNLKSECRYTYGSKNPYRYACFGTAWVYYKAVQHF